MKDPKYRREYEALQEEFSLAAALIEARTRAGLTAGTGSPAYEDHAGRWRALESGGTMPSTRTLERYADATGSRLRISFEPEEART